MSQMNLQALLKDMPAMLSHAGDSDVLLGAMCCFELNLKGNPFPGWSTSESRKQVADTLLEALHRIPSRKWVYCAEMKDLSINERMVLFERNQITVSMAARQDGVHVLINDTQDSECCINDEEHLLVQTFYPGSSAVLENACDETKKLMEEICKELPVARDPIFGYVSSNPSKSGDAIYISALMHLPGMRLRRHLVQVRRALDEMGIFISPLFSLHDTRDTADLYLLHSPLAAKGKLNEMMCILVNAIVSLYRHELLARAKMVDTKKSTDRILTSITNAYNKLLESKYLKYDDMLRALSFVRLGLYYDFVVSKLPDKELGYAISRMMYETSPVYMANALGYEKQRARRRARAEKVREIMLNTLQTSILSIQK